DEDGAELAHGLVRHNVLREDRFGLGLEVLRLAHALERPEKIHRRRAAFREQVERFLLPPAQDDAESRRAADRRRAAHHHVANRLRHLARGTAGDVFLPAREQPLIQELQPVAFPPQRLDLHQTTRSFPPSTGTCAAVVLAKSGPHISAASSATSLDATSVRSRFFRRYCSTVML